MAYTVGEMARRLGVPASTIRYYDKEGLLPFVGRSSGGFLFSRRRSRPTEHMSEKAACNGRKHIPLYSLSR